jgi:hypothetical protein
MGVEPSIPLIFCRVCEEFFVVLGISKMEAMGIL